MDHIITLLFVLAGALILIAHVHDGLKALIEKDVLCGDMDDPDALYYWLTRYDGWPLIALGLLLTIPGNFVWDVIAAGAFVVLFVNARNDNIAKASNDHEGQSGSANTDDESSSKAS